MNPEPTTHEGSTFVSFTPTPAQMKPAMTLATMRDFATDVAQSGMFGITKKEQAVCLMMICQSEGIDPVMALRRYHLIEGKPSMRADSMQGEFMARGGGIIWHVRTDAMVGATFFADKKLIDDEARDRAVQRFNALWDLDSEEDEQAKIKLLEAIADLSHEGEETLIRTFADCEAKGLTRGRDGTKTNWKASPRQMLTARVITELVRLVNPGLIAGIYSPDEVEDIVARTPPTKETNDVAAMEKMIEQYHEEAKVPGIRRERKRELLGLASELRVKIDDMTAPTPVTPSPEPPPAIEDTLDVTPVNPGPELIQDDPRREVPWQDYVLQYVKDMKLRGKRLGDFKPGELAQMAKKTAPGLTSQDQGIKLEAEYIAKAFSELPVQLREPNQNPF